MLESYKFYGFTSVYIIITQNICFLGSKPYCESYVNVIDTHQMQGIVFKLHFKLTVYVCTQTKFLEGRLKGSHHIPMHFNPNTRQKWAQYFCV